MLPPGIATTCLIVGCFFGPEPEPPQPAVGVPFLEVLRYADRVSGTPPAALDSLTARHEIGANGIPPATTFADLLNGINRDPERPNADRVSTGATNADFWGEFSSALDFPDPEGAKSVLTPRRNWKADESIKVPVPYAEPFFLFAAAGGSGDAPDVPGFNVNGRTGFGMRWLPPVVVSEVQVRCTRTLTYAERPDIPLGTFGDQTSLEMQAKVPLVGSAQFEYQSTALPPMTQAEHSKLNQDFKVALPLGESSEFHVGAKYNWQGISATTPWWERASLYLGLSVRH